MEINQERTMPEVKIIRKLAATRADIIKNIKIPNSTELMVVIPCVP